MKQINQNTEALRELLESVNNLPEGGYKSFSLFIEGSMQFSLTASSFGGITHIKNYAFLDSKLENLEIPEGVTNIGDSAFSGCNYLKSVILPSTIEKIGRQAFAASRAIDSFAIKATNPPIIYSSTFPSAFDAIITVPVGCAQAYKTAQYWDEVADLIVEATE